MIYCIENHNKSINNPKVKIIKHSDKEFINKIGYLISTNKKYGIVELKLDDNINYYQKYKILLENLRVVD